ncbi:MAG: peptidyl-prolyl cis-trans isomerase [Proteobacteria bacterium]|uniref:peptidylprolyl isomerase n=1 Tax=Thauera sp. 2A1 TaxID=2570191 RepID=UPI001292340B|nr:peptidylprolyl isomerase [Thauera sp. 2A1]KAI5916200.1 peptidylprolyl isomerase [Thauera sp. 2A1]MBS0510715.1 peptidyl-prolyl cis-trans isomerase [Pseudomonadota bacterium]MBS0551831.1 peptidyl-prolyl cis-trans isomerase [Pseudomonadota bacterium]
MKKQWLAFAALASVALSAIAANPTVELHTTQGDVVVEVFADKAPKSAENFIRYVKDGHYDGTIFHRVIDGFMVQGGGFDAAMNQKPTRAPIENEAKNGLKNVPGTLAMARTQDPHSATAQFFINLVPNTFLDYPSRDGWGYAVFGKVVKGMDVVEKIGKVPVRNAGLHQNVPVEPVVIQSARVIEGK